MGLSHLKVTRSPALKGPAAPALAEPLPNVRVNEKEGPEAEGLGGALAAEPPDVATAALNAIPGVSCVAPRGALYAFPRLDPEVYEIQSDEQLVLDLLLQEKILVVQGTGFNMSDHNHFRIVTLPWSRDLTEAIERIGNFLSSYRQ